ncbi:MAG: GntR family transcriptional regulator [Sphingomonadales bacterium]|nr:GntR family transcriptional regulator [Sphingomonadales bacterium]
MPRTQLLPPGDDLPLYAQVAATLRTAIERGLYAPGARIPTEEELCRRFKVSRHTIRDALRQLRNDGLITSRPGSRPIVARAADAPASEPLQATIASDFFDYMLGTRFAVEASEPVAISPELAAQTGLAIGESWLHLRGWRHDADDGHPTCWNDYLIRPAFAGLARTLPRHVGPLIPLIEDLSGQRITRLARATSAIPMPAAQARVFGVAPGSPALSVVTRCEIAGGEVVLLHRSIHATGTLTYTIDR